MGLAELKKQIYNVARDYKVDNRPVMGSDIPYSYTLLDKSLLRLSQPIYQAEEFKEIVRNLKQVNLQTDDEIKAATLFLHGIGSLLHFDDHRHNLDDLYFVNPQWLCKLMATVVTVKERNEYVVDGIITRDEFLRKTVGDYSVQYLDQFLTLLNRFELAFPLTGDKFLIPYFLPSKWPPITELPNMETCYECFYSFLITPPPGLWGRLLSYLIGSTSFGEVEKLFNQTVATPQRSNTALNCWATGCAHNDQLYCIKSYHKGSRNIISIIVSSQSPQRGVMTQLVNLVQQVVCEWFPGLVGKYERMLKCYECTAYGIADVAVFSVREVLTQLGFGTKFFCSSCKQEIDLKLLAPDLLFDDSKQIKKL